MPPDEIIDARNLRCPLPVLKLEKRLDALSAGAAVVVLATDPVAKIDVPLFCHQNGHSCTVEAGDDALSFRVVKGR